MMRPQILKISLAVLAVFTTFLFQNCGSPQHESKVDLSSRLSAIDKIVYPYTEKPTFYADLSILNAELESELLKKFRVILNLASTDKRVNTINFTIQVKDTDGRTVCPTQTGQLYMGRSMFYFDCISPFATENLDIEVTASADVIIDTTTSSITQDFKYSF